jgi:peptide-methionine (S)-S-oxide reductase
MRLSMKRQAVAAGLVIIAGLALTAGCENRENRTMLSKSSKTASTVGQESDSGETKTATFAAGCFWGIEAAFRQIEGVLDTSVGYTGGHAEDPTYRQVCSDTTGHAEAVQVVYDPQQVTYEKLLEVFWKIHDPTQVNRQGPDVGSQYRSAIFVHNDRQERLAKESRGQLRQAGRFGGRDIATEIVPAETFWKAEDYHQQYFEKRGGGACHVPM